MALANITNNILTDTGVNVSSLTPTSTTISTTAPLQGGGDLSANRTLSITQSGTSANGFLSSTDWNTFNNKQAAGNYMTSLTGEATGTGPGATAVTLNNASVTAKVLTGVNITGGTVVATDSILTAFGKLQNQINGLIGSSVYQGTWNAATNTPALASGVGTRGYYYIVAVAGTTNLDGITDWFIGDWAIFDGTAWQQVDNTDAVVSVNGQTGAVSLTTDNISEGATNQYFLNSRARAALSFTAGSGAYNSTTGVITIPTNTSQLTNGANFITLASLSGTAPIQYNNTTGAISITQAGAASNGFLSSTDWNTFNNKQSALTNPVTGTGTTNYLPKFTGTSTIGNSAVTDDGTTVTLVSRALSGTSASFSSSATVATFLRASSGAQSNPTGGASVVIDYQSTSDLQGRIRSRDWDGATWKNLTIESNQFIVNTGGSERMRLTSSGNLGLGVTPSAWSLGTALEIANGAAILGFNNETFIANNAYYNDGWKYRATAAAQAYFMNGGEHKWQIAPSGTAGNAISFTQAMTLNASGNLSIGNTNNTYKLDVSGTGRFNGTSASPLLYLTNTTGGTTTDFTITENVGLIINSYEGASARSIDLRVGGTSALSIASTGAATFSGQIISTAASDILTATSSNTFYKWINLANTGGNLVVGINNSAGGGTMTTSAYASYIFTRNATDLVLGTNEVARLTIASTGAATFNGGIGNIPLQMTSSSSNGTILGLTNNNVTTYSWGINAYTNGNLYFQSGTLGAGSNAFYFTSAGAATFSSSVTATNYFSTAATTSYAYSYYVNTGAAMYLGIERSTGQGLFTGSSAYATVFGSNNATNLQFGTNGIIRATITSGGNFGFNTTTPNNISGYTRYTFNTESTQTNGSIIDLNVAGTRKGTFYATPNEVFIGSDAAIPAIFLSSGNERMRITSGGNVGIGTTSPNYKLTVKEGGVAGAPLFAFIGNASNGNWMRGYWLKSDETTTIAQLTVQDGDAMYIGTATSIPFIMQTAGSERMRITSGGNVVIGGTSFSGVSSGSTGLEVKGPNAQLLINNQSYNWFTIYSATDSNIYNVFGTSGNYLIGTGNKDTSSWSEKMRITSGGNVGIGTTSPTAILHTAGNTKLGGGTLQVSTDQTFATNYSYTFRDAVGINNPNSLSAATATTVMSIGSMTNGVSLITTGAVGIGTTSPASTLDVAGNIVTTNGAGTTYNQFANSGNDVIWENRQNGNIIIRSNSSTERMRISTSGNVLIGTTTDAGYKLDVNGAGRFSGNIIANGGSATEVTVYNSSSIRAKMSMTGNEGDLSLYGSSANKTVYLSAYYDSYFIANGGTAKLGIGTSSPAYKLEVYNSSGDNHIAAVGTAPSLQLMSANTGPANWATIGMATTTNHFITGSVAGDLCIANRGTTAGNMLFGFSSSEKMRLTSNGDLCINATATTASAKLYVNGTAAFGSVYVASLGTGTVYSNAGTLTNTNPSDRRLKNNIIPLTYGLADILKLNPVSYNWKDGTNGKQFGFIAQEVQEIMPDAVKDGEYLGLEKDAIYSALVNAVKELKAELDLIKNK